MADLIIAGVGCVGAWLLVAGPVYQAALELREQDIGQQRALSASTADTKDISPWWWLVPPVAYWKRHVAHDRLRRETFAKADSEEVRKLLTFYNKSLGWLLVAAGAFLMAIKETWELGEILEWPAVSTAAVIVVATVAVLGNVVLQMARTKLVLHDGSESGGKRGADAGSVQENQ